MAMYSTITYFVLNLILFLETSAPHQVLADSNTTVVTKESLWLLDECSPTQLHISIGDSSTAMTLTWSTRSRTSESRVRYGTTQDMLDVKATGSATILVGIGLPPSVQYIHTVGLKRLIPGTKYHYVVGSDGCESGTFDFVTMPAGTDSLVSLIIFGDMGVDNSRALPQLQADIMTNRKDAILHIGDFAYNLDSNNSQTGDQFMRQIESIASRVPYMTCPGNHEILNDFFEYKTRFNMPNHENTQSMYYSWDIGSVHIISICTEFYYLPYSVLLTDLEKQYNWLLSDLEEANKNRNVRPWIIVTGHRPMYCSNANIECGPKVDSPVRVGALGTIFGLEQVFKDYNVDMYFSGHQHSFERFWPIFDRTVFNGSVEEPYRNPKATVHVTPGNGGNKEGVDSFSKLFDLETLSAFQSVEYGYVRLDVNRTHASIDYINESGQVIDSIKVIKENQP